MFKQFAKNVQELIEDLPSIIVDELSKEEAQIIDLNVEQLSEGKNSLGGNMPEYSQEWYKDYKKSKGSRSNGRYDLQDEGDYVAGAYTEKKPDYLEIDTKDEKRDKFDEYKPWGLDEKNSETIAEQTAKPIQDEIEKRFTRNIA